MPGNQGFLFLYYLRLGLLPLDVPYLDPNEGLHRGIQYETQTKLDEKAKQEDEGYDFLLEGLGVPHFEGDRVSNVSVVVAAHDDQVCVSQVVEEGGEEVNQVVVRHVDDHYFAQSLRREEESQKNRVDGLLVDHVQKRHLLDEWKVTHDLHCLLSQEHSVDVVDDERGTKPVGKDKLELLGLVLQNEGNQHVEDEVEGNAGGEQDEVDQEGQPKAEDFVSLEVYLQLQQGVDAHFLQSQVVCMNQEGQHTEEEDVEDDVVFQHHGHVFGLLVISEKRFAVAQKLLLLQFSPRRTH